MSPVRTFVLRISWFLVSALLVACAGNETTDSAPDGGGTPTDAMSFFNDTGSAVHADSTTPSSPDSTLPSGDSSPVFPDTSFPDTGSGDVDFGDTAPPPVDAGPPPPGVLVTSGADLRLWGVTDDGFAIYSSTGLASVYAVRLPGASSGADAGDGGEAPDAARADGGDAGHGDGGDAGHAIDSGALDGGAPGMPIPIVGIDATAIVVVQHDVVFVYSGFSLFSGAGTLAIWTSAGGLHMLSTASVPGDVQVTPFGTSLTITPGQPTLSLAASPDSSYVLFLDNAQPQNTGMADVVQASTSTGTKAAVVPQVSIDFTYPSLGFVGGAPSETFAVVSAQTAGFTYAIQTFAVPSWTAAQTIPSASTWVWSANQAGTKLLAFPPEVDGGAGGAVVFPLTPDAGSPTVIDPTGTFGVLTPDGNDVIYSTSGGGLMRSPVVSPAPTVLVASPPSPIAAILGLSPSEETVLFYEQTGSNQGATDLYAASAVANGPVQALSSSQTAALPFPGDSFTVDSSHALFLAAFTPPLITGPSVGTMTGAALGGDGGAPVSLGPSSVMGWATTGAKVVFNEGLGTAGTADIESVDLASASPPSVLVSQASPYFFLSPAKSLVVYAWSATPALAGLYAVPAP